MATTLTADALHDGVYGVSSSETSCGWLEAWEASGPLPALMARSASWLAWRDLVNNFWRVPANSIG